MQRISSASESQVPRTLSYIRLLTVLPNSSWTRCKPTPNKESPLVLPVVSVVLKIGNGIKLSSANVKPSGATLASSLAIGSTPPLLSISRWHAPRAPSRLILQWLEESLSTWTTSGPKVLQMSKSLSSTSSCLGWNNSLQWYDTVGSHRMRPPVTVLPTHREVSRTSLRLS